jgi:cytosine/adenosine deaminase-related metal-dependent hydrolase
MCGPLLADGAVLVDAKILAVGPRNQLRAQARDAELVDLGDCVLMPGLVNAHAHLELSLCQRPDSLRGGFVDWIKELMPQMPSPERVAAAIDLGVEQCLRFGVTTVGDISRQCHLTRPVLRDSPLRVTSFGEVHAMAQHRDLLEERLAVAADDRWQSDRLTIAVSPHAPYSVEPHGFARCLEVARQRRMPLATHLAETPHEAEFLAEHSGAFGDLWQWLGTWDDQVPRFSGGPIRFAQSLDLLQYPAVLAHVNYCDDGELDILARGRASVVYCPRTHQFFGHPPHRWREMLARGINVAVGTDSCASSPDLNLVDDLRLLHRLVRQVPTAQLWPLITTNAAKAMGFPGRVGSLALGAAADLVAFAVKTNDPLLEVLESDILPAAVWIGGRKIA